MQEKVVSIPNIRCENGVETITRELRGIEGVVRVETSDQTREVRVQWTPPATWKAILQLLVEIDYPPLEAA